MDLAKVLEECNLTPEQAYEQGLGVALDICDEEFQLQEVRKNGHVVQYIKNPSDKVQLEAVRQSWLSIQFLTNPSKEVQFEIMDVLKADWTRISYVNNLCEEIQLWAMEQNKYAIQSIKNPSENVIKLWIVQNTYEE